jgi:hypothetical protein
MTILLPPERVDQQITYEINDADVRELDLTPTDQFEIIQHVELMDMPIHVTEYRLRKYLDRDGETVLPHVPELVGRPIFGPRLLAMIGWLKSRAHCSYSTIATWMDDVLQVPVSRGYLAKLCNGTFEDQLYCVGSLQTIESNSFSNEGLQDYFRRFRLACQDDGYAIRNAFSESVIIICYAHPCSFFAANYW